MRTVTDARRCQPPSTRTHRPVRSLRTSSRRVRLSAFASSKTVCRVVVVRTNAPVALLHSPAAAAIPLTDSSHEAHSDSSSSSRSSSRRRVLSRELFWSVFLVVQFTSFMYVVRHYLFDVMSCVGPSMLPTMNASGDLVLISCQRRGSYQRGDVVVAHSPTNPRHKVCKRIIALPHDTITPPHTTTPVTVPAGHVWLQGDNLHNSSDSRLYGPVPLAMVAGRVEAKLWPLREVGWVGRTMRYSGLDSWGGGGRARYEVEEAQEDEVGAAGLLTGGRGRRGAGGTVAVLAESGRHTAEETVTASAADVLKEADSNTSLAKRPVESGRTTPSVLIIPFTPAAKRAPSSSR